MGWDWDQHDDQGVAPGGDPRRYGESDDSQTRDEEPTRIVPRSQANPVPEPDQWITQVLPPSYYAHQTPARLSVADPARRQRQRPWIIAVCALLAVAVVAGIALVVIHPFAAPKTIKKSGPDCAGNPVCKAADGYLTAYSSANFEGMYASTSEASRTHFGNSAILHGAYKDAHDYMVNRSAALIDAARVYSIAETQGAVKQTSNTEATVPAEIVMTSSRLGTFTEDITIPLVSEHGQWRVEWSPGLLFPKLDDPTNDPKYTRLVHLFTADANRGTIFDRDGNALAKDDTVFTVAVIPGQIKNESNLLMVLSAALSRTPEQIKARYAGAAPGDTVPIRTVTAQLFSQIQNQVNALVGSGVTITNGIGRVYPYGADTATVTGYVSSVTADDLKNDTKHYYEDGDVVGRAGVEAWGEESLRAVRGGKLDIVDRNADGTLGQVVYTLAARQATAGQDIHTTISLKLQQAAMASLRAKDAQYAGGAFADDPGTGEVLVMASNPTYDPNDFAHSLDGIDAKLHPQLNCALQCADPTGSIFKIVTLAAGLEHGVKSSDIFTCTGTYQVPGEDHKRIDDKPTGHGGLTAPDALGPSCDVIFWNVAVILNQKDPNVLPSVAKAFGYGEPTGIIGVPDGVDAGGLVPDPQWLQQNKHAGWTPTDAANLGIGQGFFSATPAQVALVSAALANNGIRMQPRLVTSVQSANGTVVRSFPPMQLGKLPLSADHLAVMQVAMLGSTSTPTGTSYDTFKDVPLRLGGKTGTAESGQAHPHAWFTAYAPASPVSGPAVQAKIAIGALVEYSDFGDRNAAPVVKAILKAEFNF
jgi:penicillin-binding protein 2